MRILLAVVMVAVALSLGISNFFIRNASKHPVAHVGSSYISANDFLLELENKKAQLKQRFGRLLTDQEVLSLGIVNHTLSELITKELITLEADRVGIVASDEQLSKHLHDEGSFRDSTGKFSRQLFSEFLSKSRISERKYLDDLRNVLNRGMLASVIDGQIRHVPKEFAQPMFQYLNEARDIEVVTIDIDKLPDVALPEDPKLKEFYDKYLKYFQAPETRSFNVLMMSFHEIAQTITVSSEDLMTMYSQTDNRVPEKRSVRYIPFATREDAMKATEELRSGAAFESVYSRYTGDLPENAPKAQELELKNIRPEIGSEIFSMKKVHDVSEPIFIGNQYLLFVLTDIKPERVLSFEDQKFALLKKYKSDMAREKLYGYTQRAEEMLKSGSKLADVAEAFSKEGITGVTVMKWDNITQEGKTIDGIAAPGLASFDPKVLETAFETPQYQYSDPQKLKTEDFVIVEVTDVKASHQRTFEDAKTQVAYYWQIDQKRQQATHHIKALKDGLEASQNAAELAAQHHARVDVLNHVTRANPPKDTQFAGILSRVSSAKKHEIVLDVTADRISLGRVIATHPSTVDYGQGAAAFNRKILIPIISQDILSSYIAALEGHFPVTRNDDYFANHFGKEDSNAAKPQAPDF